MSKHIPSEKLDEVIRVISQFQQGVGFEKINGLLGTKFPRRTLQRWIALLVTQQKLKKQGRLYQLSEKKRIPVGYDRQFLQSYQPNRTFYLTGKERKFLSELGRPPGETHPDRTFTQKIYHRLLIDLSWNSSRLEGNTYSLLETERLLNFQEEAEGKNAKEAQMILNHKAAIEFLMEPDESIGFNYRTICSLHALLSDNLLPNPAARGRLRQIPVGIIESVYYPLEIPQQIEENFRLLLEKAEAIQDPFEQSFFALIHLPYLQAFEDVNKRVSRLASNIPFIRNNLCPLSFVDVTERDYINGLLSVYEWNRTDLFRDVFVWAYERSCARYSVLRQNITDPDLFRLQHRSHLQTVIKKIIHEPMNKKKAIAYIQSYSTDKMVTPQEQTRFIELAENELMMLHPGNIAIYRISLEIFQKWLEIWNMS